MMVLEARELAAFYAKAANSFPAMVRQVINKTAKAVLAEAKRRAPGGIKKLLTTEGITDGFALVSAHKASVFVEEGTVAHVIEANSARALAFKVGRSMVFAKRVHHPGTRPHPFVGPAMDVAEVAFESFAEQSAFRF